MIRVACAIIFKDGKVLIAKRPPGKMLGLKWEFPGGKIKKGETAEIALHREIREELDAEIDILYPLPPLKHHYPQFTVKLIPFAAALAGDGVRKKEHHALEWVAPEELRDFDWCDADLPLVEYLAEGKPFPGGESKRRRIGTVVFGKDAISSGEN